MEEEEEARGCPGNPNSQPCTPADTELVGPPTAASQGGPIQVTAAPVLLSQAAGPLIWLLGARGSLHPERGRQAHRGAAARGHQPGAQ